MSETIHFRDPFDDSLFGEYARMLIIGTTVCSAAAWTIQMNTEPMAVVMVIANITAISRG